VCWSGSTLVLRACDNCVGGVGVRRGLAVSAPALRLRGLYWHWSRSRLARSSWSARRFADLTNGDNGIFNLQWQPPAWPGCMDWRGSKIWDLDFWRMPCHAGLLVPHGRSRIGRSFLAVRDHEIAAAAAGIRISTVKALTFAVAGALGALGGALWCFDRCISPSQFGLEQSIELLVATVSGRRRHPTRIDHRRLRFTSTCRTTRVSLFSVP